jgi:histidine triad (HIT) family protein
MLDPACIFCRIADGSAPADIIYQNDEVICFFPREMEVVGRTLIIPKEHFVDIYDIPDAIPAELMRVARILAHHYRQRIDASGVNILQCQRQERSTICMPFPPACIAPFRWGRPGYVAIPAET